jgi:hypothetical protein
MNVVSKLLKGLGQVEGISFYPADKAREEPVGTEEDFHKLL